MILSYFRAALLYLVLVAVIRGLGKRQVGEMAPSEFVVTMLVANLAAIPMQDGGIPLISGLVPILTVLGMELVLSWVTLRSMAMRRILCGKPVILVENGHILQDCLRRTRITLDELMGHLREKDVLDIQTVQYAILETNGSLSVFPYPKEQPASAADAKIKVPARELPVTLIEDGQLLPENLQRAGVDTAWILETLSQRNARVENTFLLSVTGKKNVLWVRKEAQP